MMKGKRFFVVCFVFFLWNILNFNSANGDVSDLFSSLDEMDDFGDLENDPDDVKTTGKKKKKQSKKKKSEAVFDEDDDDDDVSDDDEPNGKRSRAKELKLMKGAMKIAQLLAYLKKVTADIIANPTLDYFFGKEKYINVDMWVGWMMNSFSKSTVVFYVNEDIAPINQTFVDMGARITSDTNNTDVVYVCLKAPDGISENNCRLRSIREDISQLLISKHGGVDTFPQIFVKGSFIGQTKDDVSKLLAKSVKKFGSIDNLTKEANNASPPTDFAVINGAEIKTSYNLMEAGAGYSAAYYLQRELLNPAFKNKLTIFGKWSSASAYKLYESIMELGPTDEQFEFIDVDDERIYGKLYTPHVPNKIKKFKLSFELKKFCVMQDFPLGFVGSEFVGGSKDLTRLLETTKNEASADAEKHKQQFSFNAKLLYIHKSDAKELEEDIKKQEAAVAKEEKALKKLESQAGEKEEGKSLRSPSGNKTAIDKKKTLIKKMKTTLRKTKKNLKDLLAKIESVSKKVDNVKNEAKTIEPTTKCLVPIPGVEYPKVAPNPIFTAAGLFGKFVEKCSKNNKNSSEVLKSMLDLSSLTPDIA